MVAPLRGFPVEAAHVLLFPIPVKVEHYAVERVAGFLERVDNGIGFRSSLVAVFRGDISEAPEGWQCLAACQRADLSGELCEPFGG